MLFSHNDMDRGYYTNPGDYFGQSSYLTEKDIEQPLIAVDEIGGSVTEGSRFGSLLKTSTEAIRRGIGQIELATNMGGGQETVGAEAYGLDAREALRDLARANQISFTSVHTPTNIGNMSGYNPQERGFNDEHRKIEVEEVKKAIELAADIGGGGVVVHTGEFQRDISDQPWAMNPDGTYKFLSYNEEPGRAVLYMVDDRTGKLITEVRKSQIVHEPEFKTKWDTVEKREKWVDKDENILDESKIEDLFKRVPIWEPDQTKFKSNRLEWKHFVQRADEWNKFHPKEDGTPWTPEEMFFRSQMETRILQARGSSLYHGRYYDDELKAWEALKKAYDFYKNLEDNMPSDEVWKLMEQDHAIRSYAAGAGAKFVPGESKLPSEILKKSIEDVERSMKYTHEASSSADAQADETYETLLHVVPVETYARQQTSNSYAEVAIHAMEQTHHNPQAKKGVYVAPENIFPEMGYGSHPDELIELVHNARERMVEYLTEKEIPDPHGRRDENGDLLIVPNPNYMNMSKEQAWKEAKEHIKATLDTQHLGMWWKHFQPLQGETKDQRKDRFNKWYMEQIDKLEKADIIGHIHVVDSLGGGHHHLPVGQGDLPVRAALEYLKKKGFKGTMISEAWGEESMFGIGRQMTETWRGLGSPLRGMGGGYATGSPMMWTDVHQTYFRQMQSPYFIFGAYSPSNDWQLWSQVPME